MDTRPNQAELFGAQQEFVTLLICELDAAGTIDGDKLVALWLSMAQRNTAPGMQAAMRMVGTRVGEAVGKARSRRSKPSGAPH